MILIKSFINSRNINIRINNENQSHNIDVFSLMFQHYSKLIQKDNYFLTHFNLLQNIINQNEQKNS